MIENVKNFCDECRRLSNRSGNKQVQQFLLDAQPFVRNLADELQRMTDELQRETDENALLKIKLEDAEERAANWKELATAKGVEQKPESEPTFKTFRFNYDECLKTFNESDSESMTVQCTPGKNVKNGIDPLGREASSVYYYPGLNTFRSRIEKLGLPIVACWDREAKNIVLAKSGSDKGKEISKNKTNARYNYKGTLYKFYKSEERILEIECTPTPQAKVSGNEGSYYSWHPRMSKFKTVAKELDFPITCVWDKEFHRIILIKRRMPDEEKTKKD